MAQVALQQNTALQIVPVGIHYEAHRLFRSRVLVSFGEAIPLAKIILMKTQCKKPKPC